MIRSLSGQIIATTIHSINVEVRGIGYLVAVPTRTATFTLGSDVTLHTHLAVRENALDLYGFTTPTELELFELLLLVPKIGPKSALQILNQASPALLIESISKKDPEHLHKLAGVGKKTCENLVQFLHDKLSGISTELQIESPIALSSEKTDAIDALVALGYDLGTARTIITQSDDGMSAKELITKALKQIP